MAIVPEPAERRGLDIGYKARRGKPDHAAIGWGWRGGRNNRRRVELAVVGVGNSGADGPNWRKSKAAEFLEAADFIDDGVCAGGHGDEHAAATGGDGILDAGGGIALVGRRRFGYAARETGTNAACRVRASM